MGARSSDLYNAISRYNYQRQPQQGGYQFRALDYPAQRWPTEELFTTDMAMLSSGSLHDYLQAVRTWYPAPKVKKRKTPTISGREAELHAGEGMGGETAVGPHGISSHGFGSQARGDRESDPGHAVLSDGTVVSVDSEGFIQY